MKSLVPQKMGRTKLSAAVFAVMLTLGAPMFSSDALAKGGSPAEVSISHRIANHESWSLLNTAARESGRRAYSPARAVKFKKSHNVYLKSALAIDFTYRKANVTLPLYRGVSPQGENVYYIITEASDFDFARQLGLNYAPKLRHAVGSAGAMEATLRNGILQFKGNVDFSPERELVAGSPTPFPPSIARPGAIADENYSSVVVLPSGVVINAQIVSNASGNHDRSVGVDLKKRTVKMSLLDGFQGGKQFFYHLVTDVSADVPATLEDGVHAPKLSLLPTFGRSTPTDDSALLGFSPVLNGITDLTTGADQGFESLIANGGIDPINVFPVGPKNTIRSLTNNYSPLWDAHVNMWTEQAIKDGKVRRIVGFADLKKLVEEGLVTSAYINPEGAGNPWLFGLRPTGVVINCPVIAHPEL
jgi:hypothetical protein